MSAEKFEECLENLRRRRGDELASDFRARVSRATKRREQKAAPKASPAEKWKDLLAARQRPAGELGPEDAAAWQETVRRDRMRIRKVFCVGRLRCRYSEANEQEEIALAPPASDAAPNDSGLPSPDVSKRAEMAEKWCKFGSWQMCQTCHSMRPRPFWPGDLKRVAPPTVKKCGLCQRGVKVPQPGDVPEPLQGLPREVVAALRPLHIDVGVYEKVPHGYRVHSSMIRFAWAVEDVEDRIAALETRRQRKRARRARRLQVRLRRLTSPLLARPPPRRGEPAQAAAPLSGGARLGVRLVASLVLGRVALRNRGPPQRRAPSVGQADGLVLFRRGVGEGERLGGGGWRCGGGR